MESTTTSSSRTLTGHELFDAIEVLRNDRTQCSAAPNGPASDINSATDKASKSLEFNEKGLLLQGQSDFDLTGLRPTDCETNQREKNQMTTELLAFAAAPGNGQAEDKLTEECTTISEQSLAALVASGRGYFAQKKSASLYAVSHVYLVWKSSAPPYAPQQARAWLRDQLKRANEGIRGLNAALRNEREDGHAALSGKLTEGELVTRGVKDPAGALLRLKRIALLENEEFNRFLQVPIHFKEDEDVSFNAVVRFVFELFERVDAPLVSRYATVLEWIAAQFERDPNPDTQAIVDRLQAAGGFEAVLHARRAEAGGGGKRSAKQTNGKPTPLSQPRSPDGMTAQSMSTESAKTVMVTLRVPDWWAGFPDRPFDLHCIPLGPAEFKVIGYEHITDQALADFETYCETDWGLELTHITQAPIMQRGTAINNSFVDEAGLCPFLQAPTTTPTN
jgi:hypothetical protein